MTLWKSFTKVREILADQPINAQKLEKWIVYDKYFSVLKQMKIDYFNTM